MFGAGSALFIQNISSLMMVLSSYPWTVELIALGPMSRTNRSGLIDRRNDYTYAFIYMYLNWNFRSPGICSGDTLSGESVICLREELICQRTLAKRGLQKRCPLTYGKSMRNWTNKSSLFGGELRKFEQSLLQYIKNEFTLLIKKIHVYQINFQTFHFINGNWWKQTKVGNFSQREK